MKEAEKAKNTGEVSRSAGAGSAEANRTRVEKEIYLRACRGPLADGSCRMPEETCNHPTCPARG